MAQPSSFLSLRSSLALFTALIFPLLAIAAYDVETSPPTNVSASLLSFTGIRVSWTPGRNDTRSIIQRSTNGGPFVNVGETGLGASTFRDERLDVGTAYAYKVVGVTLTRADYVYLTSTNTATLSTPALLAYDIGATGARGSTVSGGNSISVAGAGADIGGTIDAFHFAQQSWGGDGTLVMRVAGLQPTATWAKVGVMFREDLAPGSRYVMAAVNPSGDGALLSRASPDGGSTFKISAASYSSMWVKLTRLGSAFEAYQSRDGVTWLQIGSATVDMPLNIYAGVAVTSDVPGTLCTATVDHLSISAQWNPSVPTAPTNLQSVVVSASRTEHRWQDGTSAATYDVERSSDGVHFVVVGSVPSGAQFYADTSMSRGTNYLYRVRARNDSGASAPSNTATLNIPGLSATGGPTLALQPASVMADPNTTASFTVMGAGPSATYQWQWNGTPIASNAASLVVPQINSSNAGIYTALVTEGGTVSQVHGILGVRTTAKVIDGASEVSANVVHPNGNIYDQVLLNGRATTVTADRGQITRLSFVGLNNDIVQVEFSGAGALTLSLDDATGPAPAANYNQPQVAYMRGHPSIVITGADETTNVSVFSVGRLTATNQAIFRDTPTQGVAGLGFVAISSTNGKFGGVWTANATYFQSRGPTGIYAPGVQFTGPVYLNDIVAGSDAQPMLLFGSAADVRVTGGDMQQPNIRAIQVSGITQLRFTAGTTSNGTPLPAQANQGVFEENGGDVTARIIVQQQ